MYCQNDGGDDEHVPGWIASPISCAQLKTSGWVHPALRFWAERVLMLIEHVLAPWEEKALDAAPGGYVEKLAATRAVIQAAPEPTQKMQLRMYRAVGR